jgi:hypothetical protein
MDCSTALQGAECLAILQPSYLPQAFGGNTEATQIQICTEREWEPKHLK